MTEPLSSRSEKESDVVAPFVRKAHAAGLNSGLSRNVLAAIDLSSILERLERALAVAEQLEGEARDFKARLEAAEGERDRLREERDRYEAELHSLIAAFELRGVEERDIDRAAAALSTGDRQEQHFGRTGAAAPQTGLDGHETEGGSS